MWFLLALSAFLSADSVEPRRSPGPPADLTVSVMRGEESVRRRCAACHAVGFDDASPLPSAPPFRRIVDRYPVENLEGVLANGIYVGHGPMPPFALEPDEVADIIAYMRTLRDRPRAASLR